MIKLHIPNSPGFGLPSASPFAIKAMILLKMAGIEYEIEPKMPMEGPKGKIPFITTLENEVLGDSFFIKKYIEEKFDFDFDAGLNTQDKALSTIIQRMCDEHLYWIVVYYRWCIDKNFEKGPAHFFDPIPQPMQDKIREERKTGLRTLIHSMGLGRHTESEILAIAKDDIDAISDLLGVKTFILGEKPSAADASLYSHLACMETDFFDTPTGDYVRTKPNLIEYLSRMKNRFFA